VRKTIPIDTLSMHYQRFIYASSMLDLYLKGASFEIRGFKLLNFIYYTLGFFCDDHLVNRLKYLSNKKMGGIDDV